MARKTIDPTHSELKAALAGMLERDEEISARAVLRVHSTLRNASDITRHDERRALLEQAQAKQLELRKFAGKVKHSGTAIAAKKLLEAEEKIQELEGNEAARVASHLAMITAVCELGGTAKLLKFYTQYAQIRERLATRQVFRNDNTDSFGVPLSRQNAQCVSCAGGQDANPAY